MLTLQGKVLIINALIGLLFVYSLSVMTLLSNNQVNVIENEIRQFLWNDKNPKIALKTLQKLKEQGGLSLLDLKVKQDTLKISWVFRLQDNAFLAACAYRVIAPILRENIWRCNIHHSMVKKCVDITNFWGQVLLAWSKVNYLEPQNRKEVFKQFLWMNSNILIHGKPIIWKNWIDKGILFIEDLFNNEGEVKDVELPWFEIIQVTESIPKIWKMMLKDHDDHRNETKVTDKYCELGKCKDHNKVVYKMLVFGDFAILKYFQMWLEYDWFNMEYSDYIQEFNRLPKYCNIVKYRDFQYRLMLGKVILNVVLKNWGLHPTGLCTFCELHFENVEHLFSKCKYVLPVIETCVNMFQEAEVTLNCNEQRVIFSHIHPNHNHVSNLVVTVLKQYIYRCRCQKKKPNKYAFVKEINNLHNIEYALSLRQHKHKKHIDKWSPLFSF